MPSGYLRVGGRTKAWVERAGGRCSRKELEGVHPQETSRPSPDFWEARFTDGLEHMLTALDFNDPSVKE